MNIFSELRQGCLTTTLEEMQELAGRFAGELPVNATVALYGELGVGKTSFVRGMARTWGITEPVTSPTYTIFSLYTGHRQLVHVDAYRLSSARQMVPLMIEDFLREPWCLAVEWAGHVEAWLPAPVWRLHLEIIGDRQHRVRLHDEPIRPTPGPAPCPHESR